jgi:4-carboxymuconolactone decarboxylase
MTDRYAEGLATRRDVLGDAHVDRALAGADGFTADFQDLITRYAWGEIWRRPGLDRRTRRCVTLAVLAALRCEDELALHVRAALSDGSEGGLGADELKEVLLQVAIYAGVPAANSAFAVAQRTIAETTIAETTIAETTTAETSP